MMQLMNVVNSHPQTVVFARIHCWHLACSSQKLWSVVLMSHLHQVASGFVSLKTLSLKDFKSTQTQTYVPDFLGATTIPAHQRVGLSTLHITPSYSTHFNSCLPCCRVVSHGVECIRLSIWFQLDLVVSFESAQVLKQFWKALLKLHTVNLRKEL